ncbi:hypothetical protein [Aurantivibrio plasticivorans]
MKLLDPLRQAKIEYYFQVMFSALISIGFTLILAIATTPGYFANASHLTGA